jgi:ATP adenylyltransferase
MSEPIFHSYLTAPWKAEYVKKRKGKQKDLNQCIFCAIAEQTPGVDSLEIFRDDLCLILLNKYPYNPGHLLLLPLDHYEDLSLIPPNVHIHIGIMMQRCIKLLHNTHEPRGFNIGLNMGRWGGASINHLHWHIVPRYPGDMNFMEILHTRVLIETLNQSFKKITKQIEILTK